MTIPKRLIYSIPQIEPDGFADRLAHAKQLHPDWDIVVYQDPIDRAEFRRTRDFWERCQSGAQLAGLVRLEALYRHGGIWLDQDIDVLRNLERLTSCEAFAAYEDRTIVPDAVIGAEQWHPAISQCLGLALKRLTGNGKHWTNNRGAWATGPGVTTTVFKERDDVVLLPPDSFYPVHYQPRETLTQRLDDYLENPPPWAYGVHRWAWSWNV